MLIWFMGDYKKMTDLCSNCDKNLDNTEGYTYDFERYCINCCFVLGFLKLDKDDNIIEVE